MEKTAMAQLREKLQYVAISDDTPKEYALAVINVIKDIEAKDISSILFNIYNGKKIEPVIWKMIRPEYAKPK